MSYVRFSELSTSVNINTSLFYWQRHKFSIEFLEFVIVYNKYKCKIDVLFVGFNCLTLRGITVLIQYLVTAKGNSQKEVMYFLIFNF